MLLTLESFNVKITFLYFCICMCHSANSVEVREQLVRIILFFHYTGPGDWTQVARLDSKCLYPMRCLTDTNGGDFELPKKLTTNSTCRGGSDRYRLHWGDGKGPYSWKSFPLSLLGLLFPWLSQIKGSTMKRKPVGQSLSSNLTTSEKKPYLQWCPPTESKQMLSSEDTFSLLEEKSSCSCCATKRAGKW